MPPPDPGAVLVPGPWEHRFIATNGTRLHVAEAGEGPLVLLLHGYPQFWWVWRRLIPAAADAGYRVVAVDLRGHGASDKPPTGYDAPTLAADIAGLVRSLGATRATVVGHGLGGWLAWAMPQLHPQVTRAIAPCAMPHPSLLAPHSLWPALSRQALRVPMRGMLRGTPTRLPLTDPAVLESALHAWASPASGWPTTEVVARYSQALSLPFAGRSATQAHRWLVTAPLRPAAREVMRRIRRPVDVPVLQLHGQDDPLLPAALAQRSAEQARGRYDWLLLPGVGHFVPEEAPAATADALVAWLARLPSDAG